MLLSIAIGTLAAWPMDLVVFNHWSWRQPQRDDAIDEALSHGAVAVDVPDGGVNPHGGDGQPTG